MDSGFQDFVAYANLILSVVHHLQAEVALLPLPPDPAP
jgi:hypothetical protein